MIHIVLNGTELALHEFSSFQEAIAWLDSITLQPADSISLLNLSTGSVHHFKGEDFHV